MLDSAWQELCFAVRCMLGAQNPHMPLAELPSSREAYSSAARAFAVLHDAASSGPGELDQVPLDAMLGRDGLLALHSLVEREKQQVRGRRCCCCGAAAGWCCCGGWALRRRQCAGACARRAHQPAAPGPRRSSTARPPTCTAPAPCQVLGHIDAINDATLDLGPDEGLLDGLGFLEQGFRAGLFSESGLLGACHLVDLIDTEDDSGSEATDLEGEGAL